MRFVWFEATCFKRSYSVRKALFFDPAKAMKTSFDNQFIIIILNGWNLFE
jgi:hypothetical protein